MSEQGIRVLVCGGRDFLRQSFLFSTLDSLHLTHHFSCLIEGEAPGADTMARTWGQARGVLVRPFPAQWAMGRANAGRSRNRAMLVEGRPEMVVAFDTGGPGTENMLKQARGAGFEPLVFDCQAMTRAEGLFS